MGVPVSDNRFSGVTGHTSPVPHDRAWLCAGSRHFAVSRSVAAFAHGVMQLARRLIGRRVVLERWLRYRMPIHSDLARAALQRLASCNLRVEAMSEQAIAELAALYPKVDQVVSACSLWAQGFRRAYLARDATGRPVAFVWTMCRDDNGRLRQLRNWGGMYPPIADGWVQVENVFCASRSLGRGQLMTDLAYAAVAATDVHAVGILAHVGHGNRAVRRWIDSLGCQKYGEIVRGRIELPVLRRGYVYVHLVDAVEPHVPSPAEVAPLRTPPAR